MQLGILRLETTFERLPGDAGHAATWPFAVQWRTLHGLTPDTVMQRGQNLALEGIVQAMQELVADGAGLITTTCGFLVAQQTALAARCPVPFISSSLLQIPALQAMLPEAQSVGVLASNANALTAAHWRGAGVQSMARLRVAGFAAHTHFIRYMRGQDKALDAQQQQDEVLAAAGRLVRECPDVGAIVSECANLPRYSTLVQAYTKRPVFDLRSLVLWQASAMGAYNCVRSAHSSGNSTTSSILRK